MPSRLRTPRPPSLPSAIAVAGETTPSIAEARSGSSSRCGPSFQPMSTSCGSRVLRLGTIAMSSKPYACRAFLPRPISTSTRPLLYAKNPGSMDRLGQKNRVARRLSKWQSIVPASGDDRLELGYQDATGQAARLARVEAPRPDLERGRGARSDRSPQRLVERLLRSMCGEEGGQEHVP